MDLSALVETKFRQLGEKSKAEIFFLIEIKNNLFIY
jgi:hypothetical protein